MSRATKRKHVMKEVLEDDFSLPTSEQEIVRVLESRGNNLHQVESADKNTFLISMPTKFRRTVWVKRGDYILIEPIAEGDKVKGEMVRVLSNEHIKYFKKNNKWPVMFDENDKSDEEDNDDDLFVNTNRPPPIESSEDESNDSNDSDSEHDSAVSES